MIDRGRRNKKRCHIVPLLTMKPTCKTGPWLKAVHAVTGFCPQFMVTPAAANWSVERNSDGFQYELEFEFHFVSKLTNTTLALHDD
jgi:hypothetical protein